MHHKLKNYIDTVCKSPMEIHRNLLPTKCPVELKDNSNVWLDAFNLWQKIEFQGKPSIPFNFKCNHNMDSPKHFG